MAQTPIAYADATGFVTYPLLSGEASSRALETFLTPLYTQEQIDESMAKFYLSQGLNADGTDRDDVGVQSIEVSEMLIAAEQAARVEQDAAHTGVSIADDALAALGMAVREKGKK